MYSYIVNLLSSKLFSIEKEDQTETGEWTRYYVEVFLVNILKTLLILSCSLIFNTLLTTITCLICFRQLRKYAQGWHSEFSLYCSFQCLCFFVLFPKLLLLANISFNLYVLTVIFFVELILFLNYCQIESEESKNIKKKICVTLIIFYSLSILFTDLRILQYGIIIGVLSESVLILPISKKLVKGEFFYAIKKIFTGKNELSSPNAVKRKNF